MPTPVEGFLLEALSHLHQIERNLFFVEESEIDLPDWG